MKNFLKLMFFGVADSPSFIMINPANGEEKKMATGFSWTVLLLGGFFGLPLFFKRLWLWAWGLFFLSTASFWDFYLQLSAALSATTAEDLQALAQSDLSDTVANIVLLTVTVLLAFKSNEWAVKRLLDKGWRFKDVDDALVKKYAEKWHISKHYMKTVKDTERL